MNIINIENGSNPEWTIPLITLMITSFISVLCATIFAKIVSRYTVKKNNLYAVSDEFIKSIVELQYIVNQHCNMNTSDADINKERFKKILLELEFLEYRLTSLCSLIPEKFITQIKDNFDLLNKCISDDALKECSPSSQAEITIVNDNFTKLVRSIYEVSDKYDFNGK